MGVTIELSDNRAILAFNQSIIVAVPGPRFGELNVQFLQHKLFADTFQCDDSLELHHLIDGIDMINPFTFILIALMDRVYADIAGLIVRARFTPLG